MGGPESHVPIGWLVAKRGDLPLETLKREATWRRRSVPAPAPVPVPRRPVPPSSPSSAPARRRYRGGKCIRGHVRPPEFIGKKCPECYPNSYSLRPGLVPAARTPIDRSDKAVGLGPDLRVPTEIWAYETDLVRHATREFDVPMVDVLDAYEERYGGRAEWSVQWNAWSAWDGKSGGVRTEMEPEEWYERGREVWEPEEPAWMSDKGIHIRAKMMDNWHRKSQVVYQQSSKWNRWRARVEDSRAEEEDADE